MRVYLGSDHGGYELKQAIVDHLREGGHEPVDCGAYAYDAEDDYPAFCIAAALKTVADPGSLGIVLGGSGNGEQIAANKVTVTGTLPLSTLDETIESVAPAVSEPKPQSLTRSVLT